MTAKELTEKPRGVLDAVDRISTLRSKNHKEILQWNPETPPNNATSDDIKNVGPNARLKKFSYRKYKRK